jgi:WD40 repeat protein
MASVFLSHSSRDGPVVEAIAAFLRDEEHHSVFLDRHPEDGIHVGERWEQVLYDRLNDADVVVSVVTESYVASSWCFAEVALAKALGRLVLPVGAQAGVHHPLLESVQAVDYRADPVAARSALSDRLRVIEAGGGTAWDRSRPLFPGLLAFDASDAPVFFGREPEVDRLAALVRSLTTQRAPKAVVVVGGSGSGKSSLVRAGLVPRLVADGWWAVPPVLPGPDPLRALAFAVGQAWKELRPERRIDLRELSQQVTEDLAGVAAELLLAAPGSRQGLLLVIDQFEEVFTRTASADAMEFLAVLNTAAEAGRPTAVVATMRSEFLGELLACGPAGPFRASQFPLVPLDRARLAGIIKGPARKGQLVLSDDLVQRLVEDTGSGEALPLLAYVLRLLTEHSERGDRIGVEQYEQINGVQGALRARADETLTRAVAATGHTAEEILKAFADLASLDDAGRPTRRRIPRSAIPADLLPAFEMFVSARLVSSDGGDGEPEIAVSHEALFTAWPQLSAVITSQTERLRLLRRLEQSAADWDQAGHEPSILWRGEQLRHARAVFADMAGLPDRERRFLDQALAEDADTRRREADILADRIRASGLIDRDSELALLLLLAAADEYAPTDSVIGGLRQTLARHRLIGRIPAPDAQVTALAVSGENVAVADLGTNIRVTPSTRPQPLPPAAQCRINVWHTNPLGLAQTLWIDGRRVQALDLRDGSAGLRLAVGIDERIVVPDLAAETGITGGVRIGSKVRHVALSPGGDRVVAQALDGSLVIVDVTSGNQEPAAVADDADAPARPEAASWRQPRFDGPNDTVVIDEGWPEAFRIAGWQSPPSGTGWAWSVPDRRVVVQDLFGTALFTVEPVDAPAPIGHVDGQAQALRWRPDGKQLAFTTDGRVIDLGSGATHGPLGTIHAVSRDGGYVLLGEPLRIHAPATGSERPLPAVGTKVRAAGFSEDGQRLAVASWGSLSIFDVPTGSLVTHFGEHSDEEGDVYEGVGLNHNGTYLMTASLGGGRARVWDIATGQPIRPVPGMLFGQSPDGADVVDRGFREIAADLPAGVEFRFRARGGVVATVAPDRLTLLAIRPESGSGPDIGRAEEYTIPEGHPLFLDTEPCVAATFSPDSQQVMLARADGTIVVSPLRTAADVLTRARSHVFRPLKDEDRASFALHPAR